MIQLRPAFARLACGDTLRGGVNSASGSSLHEARRVEAGFVEQAFFHDSAPTTARSITLRSWPKLESSWARSSNFFGERVGPL